MCHPFSCVVHKTRGVLVSKKLNEHSHTSILIEHKIPDTILNVSQRDFVRIEIWPTKDFESYGFYKRTTKFSDYIKIPVEKWHIQVDERGTLPPWYISQQKKWDNEVVKAAKKWLKKGRAIDDNYKNKYKKSEREISKLAKEIRQKEDFLTERWDSQFLKLNTKHDKQMTQLKAKHELELKKLKKTQHEERTTLDNIHNKEWRSIDQKRNKLQILNNKAPISPTSKIKRRLGLTGFY